MMYSRSVTAWLICLSFVAVVGFLLLLLLLLLCSLPSSSSKTRQRSATEREHGCWKVVCHIYALIVPIIFSPVYPNPLCQKRPIKDFAVSDLHDPQQMVSLSPRAGG